MGSPVLASTMSSNRKPNALDEIFLMPEPERGSFAHNCPRGDLWTITQCHPPLRSAMIGAPFFSASNASLRDALRTIVFLMPYRDGRSSLNCFTLPGSCEWLTMRLMHRRGFGGQIPGLLGVFN